MGLGTAADMVEPTWDEFAAAVRDQEAMVRRRVALWGRAGDVDLVMSEVQSTAWERLDAWRSLHPRPRLAAYVNGIAVRCVQEWRRRDMTKRGGPSSGAQEVSVDVADLQLPDGGPCAQLDGSPIEEQRDDAFGDLAAALRTLHRLVIAQPGGTAAWQKILTDAHHGTRGEQLRTEIRLFLHSQATSGQAPVGPRLAQIMTRSARTRPTSTRRAV